MPPLHAVTLGHRRLREALAALTDDQVAAPSLLPGWSRGHVLAHLTDNARAFARVSELALRGELVDAYEGGQAERDAIIEGLAASSADEHRSAIARHSAALEAVWSQAAADDWARPVRFRNGDLGGLVHMRWREVWIHLVDLDLGVGPQEWTDEFSCHAVDFLLPRLPDGVALRQTDGPRRWTTSDADGHPGISGRARDLAAWLAGRTPERSPLGPLPDLGPWPAHPAPIPDQERRTIR
ncbi:maleylpyruvate isomerase family mycothiol-dependent enzyme [Saccharopolyspora shandongensis]|uniref:maleylpyruvate isomerase family mycothiol-dependent enzyme n=1 Tax=Saccharopolyspora shandongensis TaxID=418495 RepID=UPI003437CD69